MQNLSSRTRPHVAHYAWPFFDSSDLDLARAIDNWATESIHPEVLASGDERTCTSFVRLLGESGWLKSFGESQLRRDPATPRLRTLCIVREVLGRHSDIADFCFAMQGLAAMPLVQHGSRMQREQVLRPLLQGSRVGAFALSEPHCGSDPAAIGTMADVENDHYVINGVKSWVSNAGIADLYVVFVRTQRDAGAAGLSCLLVEANTPGLEVQPVTLAAPRPFGTLHLRNCRIPKENLVGREGSGFRIASDTLELFRPTVGAAALGMARRALHASIDWARERRIGPQRLIDLQLTQHKLSHMALEIDSAALLVARAAWACDERPQSFAYEAALAKWHATESAQRVVDQFTQLLGARGVVAASLGESLTRSIRSLRIYEGTSEVQQLIVANALLKQYRK